MEWTCRCGAFSAEVDPSEGIRAVCYCRSCREFAEMTEAGASLDDQGGSDLFQVAPERIRFLKGGAENLTWTRLTEKGPVRWYTTCCNTPVANTLATSSWPFVTLQTHRFADPEALGPVTARVNRGGATGRVPDDSKGTGYLIRNFIARAIRSRLSGGWKRNPFFGPDRQPVAPGGTVKS